MGGEYALSLTVSLYPDDVSLGETLRVPVRALLPCFSSSCAASP